MEPKIGSEGEVSVCTTTGEESDMSTKLDHDQHNITIKQHNFSTVSKSDLDPSKKKVDTVNASSVEVDKTRKSKNIAGKKKGKVDWTPELHKKFVQAVEQLGLDKAVPSKILELMGIDCLTRHNVASHLQKYRSHQKHLLAREAEAANWNRRRQAYGTAGGIGKKDRPFCVPITGFPPVTHFRPLHVWGHPSPHQSLMHMWPKPPLQSPMLTGVDTSPCWYYQHQDVPAPGVPCSLPQVLPTGYPPPPVPGIPQSSMHTCIGVPAGFTDQVLPQPPSVDLQLSKESIDAAIGDVLSRPWLPLPLGLKPPSIDSVMTELQRQGISRIQSDLYLASR